MSTYHQSPYKALCAIYQPPALPTVPPSASEPLQSEQALQAYEHPLTLLPWKFRAVPKNHWNDVKHQREWFVWAMVVHSQSFIILFVVSTCLNLQDIEYGFT